MSRSFFSAVHEIEPRGLCCYLIHQEALDKPSLLEMSERLGQAVEAEFTKQRMSRQINVVWWNLLEERTWPSGPIILLLEFGGGGELREGPHVRLPRLQEIYGNPVTKRDTWKLIQASINRCLSHFANST